MSESDVIVNSEDPESLPVKAQGLYSRTRGDEVASIVKAAFNLVPLVGGPVSSLMSDFIPQSSQKRVQEFATSVAGEFARLGGRIDEELAEKVNTDEFAFMFTKVFTDVTREYQQEKLEAYRNVLVNALVAVDVEAAIQESYLNRLESLTALHMKLIPWFGDEFQFAALLAQARARGVPVPSGPTSLGIVLASFTGLDRNIVRSLVHDLDVQGITDRVVDSLGVTATPSGASDFHGRLTDYGRGFVSFVSQPL